MGAAGRSSWGWQDGADGDGRTELMGIMGTAGREGAANFESVCAPCEKGVSRLGEGGGSHI